MPISKGHTSATGKGRSAKEEPKSPRIGKGNKGKHPKQTKKSSHHRDPTKGGHAGGRP